MTPGHPLSKRAGKSAGPRAATALATSPAATATNRTPVAPATAAAFREQAVGSLFQMLESICEGAIIVDRDARIVWISDKYLATLGLARADEALGRAVEEVIPTSLMRQVVETGEPILLDIMEIRGQSLVVTRLPLRDAHGVLTGALGFVLFDRPRYLKPLMSKFVLLQRDLAAAQRALADQRRPKYTLSSFVGTSAPCLEVKRQARRAAQLDTTVLLQGETGIRKKSRLCSGVPDPRARWRSFTRADRLKFGPTARRPACPSTAGPPPAHCRHRAHIPA